jgi:hypothetical protein
MNNQNQSAVKWLMEKITHDNGFGQRLPAYIETVDLSKYFEEAHEMEERRVMDAHSKGWEIGTKDGYRNASMKDDSIRQNGYEMEVW